MLLDNWQLARLDREEAPVLTVVVDTEEEFDWSNAHSRADTSVTHMRHIHRVQNICDDFGVRPCYAIDYPIASQESGFGPLVGIHDDGRCSIGAHLHPWVNPPHEEDVNARNSYPGNLPAALERTKLEILNAKIQSVFGRPAVVYKAGRFGVGPNTGAALESLGFTVDVSPMSAFDFSADGGPNFERFPGEPWWFGEDRRLLCIPGTGSLVGMMGPMARPCYRLATQAWLQRMRMPGILARLRLVDRLRLSPEGYTLEELRRLTQYLLARGVRVFSLSFHSPSVEPGRTPYVRSVEELEAFLDRLRGYFDYFFDELKGRTMSPTEIRAHLLSMDA